MTAAAPPTAEDFVRRLLATDDADKRASLIAHHNLSSEDLRSAVLTLLTEAERLMGADPRRMEQVCTNALALAEQARDDYFRAMACMYCGDAKRAQGQNGAACTNYDEAAAIFAHLNRPVEVARTRIGWIDASAKLGRTREALAAAHEARRVFTAHGETLRVARLTTQIGIMHSEHGRYHAALRAYNAALDLFHSLGEGANLGLAGAHQNRGLVLTRLGRHREALAELEIARETYELTGQAAGVARAARSIGETLLEMGRYSAALRALEAARSAFRALGVRGAAAVVAQDSATCYLRINRPADALIALADAEEDLRQADSAQDALGIATRRVAAYLMLGNSGAAMSVLDDAEHRFPTGAIHYRAWLAVQHSAMLLRDGLHDQALATAQQAGELAHAAGIRQIVADALTIQGRALLALGNVAEAERSAVRARRIARRVGTAPLLHRVYELLGSLAESRGRPATARRHYIAAVEQLEREQQGVIFEFRDSFAADRGIAYERLAMLHLLRGDPAEALVTAERAKSRALSDAIAGTVELRPQGNAVAQRLIRELTTAREQYAVSFARAADNESEGAIALEARTRAGEELAQMEARIAAMVQRLQLEGAAGDVADLYGATPVVLPSLPADTTLLEFFFSGDDILRFHMAGKRVCGHILPGAVPEVERLLRVFRLNLGATENTPPERRDRLAAQAQTVLVRLYDQLLGGLNGLDRTRALVIVPHGLLHYLPFHALYDGERYLVQRFPISYAPSAAIYGICHARALRSCRGAALVLAHSNTGRLPLTLQEADAVGAVLGAPVHREQAATRVRLEQEGRRAGLIHIAAHGRFRPDAPLFSHIELADGPLTTADVFNLDLRAGLVTLSACETGRTVLGGGDELAGLTRAFLYAGAGGLLVSQWRVDDAVTARLMVRFYEELARGAGRASALRAAQLACLSPETPENAYRHPFYWAGFQIIGDDQGLQRRPVRAR